MIYLALTWLVAPLLWLRAALRGSRRTNRILVIQTAKIGDFVATTPVFRALRTRLPGTEIVALLNPVNAPLPERLDCIDRIVALPKHGFKGWAGKRWLLCLLVEGYDGGADPQPQPDQSSGAVLGRRAEAGVGPRRPSAGQRPSGLAFPNPWRTAPGRADVP